MRTSVCSLKEVPRSRTTGSVSWPRSSRDWKTTVRAGHRRMACKASRKFPVRSRSCPNRRSKEKVRFRDYGLRYSSIEIAKFRLSASLILKVVIPMRFPLASNSPPPDEPPEIAAVVCTSFCPSSNRSWEIIPLLNVLLKPPGEPMVMTGSPICSESNDRMCCTGEN